jgi:diaminopimelate epimerase
MEFEKWQALGNDYLIFEAEKLPWELTPERIRALCHPNFGPGGDGILLLASDPNHVAHLRIFNPDGSEAELSGNGAREAAMYLRERGWTDLDRFTMLTAAGVVEPIIHDDRTCTMAIGRASTSGADWPAGPEDGRGLIHVGDSEREFQFVHVGNPQVAIEFSTVEEIDALDLPAVGAPIEANPMFPNRTNVSFWAANGDGIRARIFERGVGETMSSGTGSSGAAVAAFMRGHAAPVTVSLDGGELTVAISANLDLDLTGWAVPVYAGVIAPNLMEELS